MERLRSQGFHKGWLVVTAIVIGSFGPVFFLGTMEATSEPARWTLDLLSSPLDNAQSYDFATMRFLSALTGGFLLGWGVMILCLRSWAYVWARWSWMLTSAFVSVCVWLIGVALARTSALR